MWRAFSIPKVLVLVCAIGLIWSFLHYEPPQLSAPVPTATAPVTPVPEPAPPPASSGTPAPIVIPPPPAPKVSLKPAPKVKPRLTKRPKYKPRLNCTAVPAAAYNHEKDTVMAFARARGVPPAKLAVLSACIDAHKGGAHGSG